MSTLSTLKITLNGDPFDIAEPLTLSGLIRLLKVDPRGIALEHNLVVVKRSLYDSTAVREGDQIEIVNFVGGG